MGPFGIKNYGYPDNMGVRRIFCRRVQIQRPVCSSRMKGNISIIYTYGMPTPAVVFHSIEK